MANFGNLRARISILIALTHRTRTLYTLNANADGVLEGTIHREYTIQRVVFGGIRVDDRTRASGFVIF